MLTAGVGYISYIALKRLTFADPDDEVRLKLAKRGAQLRVDLISKHNAKEVSFDTPDGVGLKALYIKRDKAVGTMVLCHGYRSVKEKLYRLADMFSDFDMVMFDFRGHGQSGGDVISIGCHEYKDVTAAAAFARDRMKEASRAKQPLVVLGLSMGGAASLQCLALDHDMCDALIVDSSYADLWEVVNDVFTHHSGLPQFPFLPIMETMFITTTSCDIRDMRPVEFARDITKPVFFIHSCQDLHTKTSDTLRIFGATKSKGTKLWIGPECEHARLHKFHAEDYEKKVREFLKKLKLI